MTGKRAEQREIWRQRIDQQEKSGESIRRFCQQRGLSEQVFYYWRQKVRTESPMTFALVETKGAADGVEIEVVLASGDRLRVPAQQATLRMVLAVLREGP
jgi:hypothetical protein